MIEPPSASPTTLSGLRALIACDLFRLEGKGGTAHFLNYYLRDPGFRIVALFRICRFLRLRKTTKYTLYIPALLWFLRVSRIYGVRLPLMCEVGPGFQISHWGGIWINPEVTIGKNFSISQSVTLGTVSRAGSSGAPKVGNNVGIGPGACVLGDITIGDHALVSANSVVLQSIPENGVVMGVPARPFSSGGSGNYVKNTV